MFSSTPTHLTPHVLERDDCPIHYWIGGQNDKPIIVMMHGATMDHRMFNAQVEALLPDYRVLVWDARGHGLSQPAGRSITLDLLTRDMLAILDTHQMQSCVAVGQSMGGYIAQKLYELAPEQIQGMVIIGSTPIAKAYGKLDIFALKASVPLINLIPYRWFSKMVAQSTAITQPVQHYALGAIRQIPPKSL